MVLPSQSEHQKTFDVTELRRICFAPREMYRQPSLASPGYLENLARRTMVIRMTLPTAGKLVWQCGEHTVELESAAYILFLIPCYQHLLFSVARGA